MRFETIRQMAVTTGLVGLVLTGCGGKDDGGGTTNTTSNAITIGGMFQAVGDGVAPQFQRATELAIEEVNASGLLSRKLELQAAQITAETDRAAVAKALVDQKGAKAFVAELSSTGLVIVRLTAQSGYDQIVQCNSRSTASTLNDPAMPSTADGPLSDQNDTLYRTMRNERDSAKVAWELMPDKAKVGSLIVADVFGESWHRSLRGEAGSTPFAADLRFPVEWRDAVEKTKIDEILAKNREGQLTSLIVVGQAPHGTPILKALTEANPPFSGRIIAIMAAWDLSTMPSAFASWLSTPGNEVATVYPVGPPTEAGLAFQARLKAKWPGEKFDDNGNMLTADCVYAIALAMAMAEKDGLDPATGYKPYMKRFDQSSMEATTTMGASVDSLTAAKAALASGAAVRIEAATGPLVFDANGDRATGTLAVGRITGSGPFAITISQIWDPSTRSCVQGCR